MAYPKHWALSNMLHVTVTFSCFMYVAITNMLRCILFLYYQTKHHFSGRWYTYPSETYELVSWDHEIPNIWKVIKVHGSKAPTRDY